MKYWQVREVWEKRKTLSVWIFSIISLPSINRLCFVLVNCLWIVKVTSPWNQQDYRICHRLKRVLGHQLFYSTLCCLGTDLILSKPPFDRNLLPLACVWALRKPKAISAWLFQAPNTFAQVHVYMVTKKQNRILCYFSVSCYTINRRFYKPLWSLNR